MISKGMNLELQQSLFLRRRYRNFQESFRKPRPFCFFLRQWQKEKTSREINMLKCSSNHDNKQPQKIATLRSQ